MGSIPGSGRFLGEGYDNSLLYSCQENPIDRGAWWATVHRVTKSYWAHIHTQVKMHIPSDLISTHLKHWVLRVTERPWRMNQKTDPCTFTAGVAYSFLCLISFLIFQYFHILSYLTLIFLNVYIVHLGHFRPQRTVLKSSICLNKLSTIYWEWVGLKSLCSGRTDVNRETVISPLTSLDTWSHQTLSRLDFGRLMQTANSLEKSPMLGKTEGRRRRGCQRMRWLVVMTHAMDLNLGKLPGDGEGQGGLAHCSLWSC